MYFCMLASGELVTGVKSTSAVTEQPARPQNARSAKPLLIYARNAPHQGAAFMKSHHDHSLAVVEADDDGCVGDDDRVAAVAGNVQSALYGLHGHRAIRKLLLDC